MSTPRLGFYRRFDGWVIHVHRTDETHVFITDLDDPDYAETREFFESDVEWCGEIVPRHRHIDRWLTIHRNSDEIRPMIFDEEPS